MKKCPVCSKDKSEFEMRPLVNVEELDVGDVMSERDTKEDVGGAKLHVVCRSCWLTVLKDKSKDEIMELLETICGLLLEVGKAKKESWGGASFEPSILIEKATKYPFVPPSAPIGVPNISFPGNGDFLIGNGTTGSNLLLDSSSRTVSSNQINMPNLAVQWGHVMFGDPSDEAVSKP